MVVVYLVTALGVEGGRNALQVIKEVHDLSELSSHPIMLKLISQHIPDLMALKEQQRTVNAATLYLKLFDAVGERDGPKHIIALTDKQSLLADLALHLWQKQQTSLSVKKLRDWFIDYGTQHPVIRLSLGSMESLAAMLQDLCNASLLVRDDRDQYRFAHTSYLEFFQAIGLFENIRLSETGEGFDAVFRGAKHEVSMAVIRFLADWRQTCEAEDREIFDQRFKAMLTLGGSLEGKTLGHQIWYQGHEVSESFPHVTNPDWSGLSFVKEFAPNRAGARNLAFCNLTEAFLSQVSLDGSIYPGRAFARRLVINVTLNNVLWMGQIGARRN